MTIPKLSPLLLLITAFTTANWANLATAADNAPEVQDSKPTTRVYHVQDLLLLVQNYPLRSALVQPSQVRGREPKDPAAASLASVGLIPHASMKRKASDSWRTMRWYSSRSSADRSARCRWASE